MPLVVLTASSNSFKIEPPPPNSASPSFIASLNRPLLLFWIVRVVLIRPRSRRSPSYTFYLDDLYSLNSAIFFLTSAMRFARASASGIMVFGRSSVRIA